MSSRRRRFTLNAAAVLAVLYREENRVWSVTEVAEECGVEYGSVYPILKRLWGEGLVGEQYVAGGFGVPKLHYDLSPRGWDIAARLLQFMPNPVEALTAWIVEPDESDESAPTKPAPERAAPAKSRKANPTSPARRSATPPTKLTPRNRAAATTSRGRRAEVRKSA